MQRLRVLHIITNLAVGGASETAIAHCRLADPDRIEASILCGAASPGEPTLVESAMGDGVKVEIFDGLKHALNPIADWRASHALRSWLRINRVDVVHTHGSKAGVLGRIAASKASVPAIIHTVHGWGHHSFQHPLMRRILIEAERKAALVTNHMIAVSQVNVNTGLEDGIGLPEQYSVIPSGIPIEKFRDVSVDSQSMRSELGIPHHAVVIGTVGRLAPQKAPQNFVSMAAIIAAEVPNSHFIWAGGGPLEHAFLDQIERCGLQGRIHYLGYRDDVPQLLRVFDVFVLTSLWEGLPRVFPQAMCAQLPIVATRVDGAAEAIDHGITGFLVDPGDSKTQSEYVVQLLNDPELRVSMGNEGLRRVDPKFSEVAMARAVEQIYYNLFPEF